MGLKNDEKVISREECLGLECTHTACTLRDKKTFIAARVKQEFGNFKRDMLLDDKEEMFMNYYKIRFYDCLTDYFVNDRGNLDEKMLSVLEDFARRNVLLSVMYDEFISNEFSKIETQDDISEFVYNFASINGTAKK